LAGLETADMVLHIARIEVVCDIENYDAGPRDLVDRLM